MGRNPPLDPLDDVDSDGAPDDLDLDALEGNDGWFATAKLLTKAVFTKDNLLKGLSYVVAGAAVAALIAVAVLPIVVGLTAVAAVATAGLMSGPAAVAIASVFLLPTVGTLLIAMVSYAIIKGVELYKGEDSDPLEDSDRLEGGREPARLEQDSDDEVDDQSPISGDEFWVDRWVNSIDSDDYF